jgi:hypothetical protein
MGSVLVEVAVVEGGVAPKSAVAAAGRWEIEGRRGMDQKGSAGLQRGVEAL